MKTAILVFVVAAMLGMIALSAGPTLADDHYGSGRHFGRHGLDEGAAAQKGAGKGNKTAGTIAAWLLVVANFPVAFSVAARLTKRFGGLRPESQKRLTHLNQLQKKHLMPFHYYLNLPAGLMALWHWLTSCCRATAFPEYGLAILVLMITLGIVMKWKFFSKPAQKIACRVHTHPALLAVMVLVLVIGHGMMG